VTGASRYLTALAKQLAAGYVAQTNPRAILLTGSAAEGVSDYFSDLDLIVYYEKLPSPDQLAAARMAVQATDFSGLSGDEKESFIEGYVLQGVECQVAHLTVAEWERDMRSVLEACEPATHVEKAISGLLAGVALHGGDLIEQWQAQAAAYPEGLAHATVEHHLRFFPLWLSPEWWQERDATIFYHQMLVETSLNLLAALAGLNHVYFSSFQFKRLHRFAGTLRLAPERLAERLDNLFALDRIEAGLALERLVEETFTLVEVHMPEVDTAAARRHLGVRQRPWNATTGPNSAEREGWHV
jgi:hypothetical protein